MTSFHLENIKSVEDKESLSSTITSFISKDSTILILLFVSPKYIINEPWKEMIKILINNKSLKLAWLDKAR